MTMSDLPISGEADGVLRPGAAGDFIGLNQGIQVRQGVQVGRAGVAALRRHRHPGVGRAADHLPVFRPGHHPVTAFQLLARTACATP
jgi:hypothetical protein